MSDAVTPEEAEEAGAEGDVALEAAADGPALSRKALRLSSSWTGRALLIAFGVGIGIASTIAFVDSPDEFRTVSQQGGGEFFAGPLEDGEAVTDEGGGGGGGTRFVTRGGSQGQAGSEGAAGVGGAVNGPGGSGPAAVNPGNFKCAAGQNGGSTDTGVSGNAIKVAANVVLDGPGASFLREALIGIQAVLDQVNVEGICGRKIVLTHRNDQWDASKGLSNIQNYIDDGAFALVVNPSSEGLNKATITGVINKAGIPVVGSDGMLISQYRFERGGEDLSQWIWPVAASTISTMHIVAQHAKSEGAKTFGLVWDEFYKFGTEGKNAFYNHLQKLGVSKSKIIDVPILPGREQYTQKANDFNNKCSGMGGCDLVAMLLDSSTAVTWIKANATFGDLLTTGPQTLFNDAFATNCEAERKKLPGNKHCELIVFTGYNPPVGSLVNLKDVSDYVAAINARDGQADISNSFTEGAYLGAQVFVEALEKVGPNVTRDNLRAVLDNMTYKSDLTNTLTWSRGNHFANTRMQAFRVGFTPEQGFTGWARETDWIKDSRVGQE